MKILQINTVCGYGSTGRNALELADILNEKGYECFIAYGQGTTSYEKSFKIGSQIENHFHNLLSRLLGNQGYYTTNGTKRLLRYIQVIKPDVFHLNNLHGNYLNIPLLFNFLVNIGKPVMWTLHDCWTYTGKCAHYTDANCYKWEEFCNRCPQVHKYPPSMFFDRTEQLFSDKKRLFTSLKKATVVTVSKWLKEEVNRSFLSCYPVTSIYNWIDQRVFRPIESDIRNKYGIDEKDFVILGVSAGWSAESRKFKDFIALSKRLENNMKIVLVGKIRNKHSIPQGVIHIPYLENTGDLAKVYSMADVYVHTSTEDTFGKVIAEAEACGTPAIVYDSTGCPEVVGKACGFVVEKNSVDLVFQKVIEIAQTGKKRFSRKCIEFVSDNFNYARNCEKYISLYSQVTNL